MSHITRTPGPWKLSDDGVGFHGYNSKTPATNFSSIIGSTDAISRSNEENSANAAHIVACVNACEGIQNPSAIIEKRLRLKNNLGNMIELVANATQHPELLKSAYAQTIFETAMAELRRSTENSK